MLAVRSPSAAWAWDSISPGISLGSTAFPASDRTDPEDVHSVETEVTHAEVRADIVISTSSGLIIIENKIDAAEGDNQCQRLFEAFEDENAWLIFLTPQGRLPSSAPASVQAHFRSMSYRQIQQSLITALESRQSNPETPGRASALNYLATLQKELL
jgi:hypothetical protein